MNSVLANSLRDDSLRARWAAMIDRMNLYFDVHLEMRTDCLLIVCQSSNFSPSANSNTETEISSKIVYEYGDRHWIESQTMHFVAFGRVVWSFWLLWSGLEHQSRSTPAHLESAIANQLHTNLLSYSGRKTVRGLTRRQNAIRNEGKASQV